MSGGAIVMMLLAMLVIWGGFALALVNLSRRSDSPGGAGSGEHRDG